MADSDPEDAPNHSSPVEERPLPAAESPKPAPTARRVAVGRNPHLREELLAKLPQLSFRSLSVTQALDLSADLGSVVDLNADAFLEPLEGVAPGANPGSPSTRTNR